MPMAHPAQAILASTLFDGLAQDSKPLPDVRSDLGEPLRSARRRKRVGTGCVAVDDVLGGGLAYGEGGVCCISGEQGGGKSVVRD